MMRLIAQSPIIVKLIEPPKRGPVGEIADVLVGAIGITGIIVLGAVVLGGVLGAVLYYARAKRGL